MEVVVYTKFWLKNSHVKSAFSHHRGVWAKHAPARLEVLTGGFCLGLPQRNSGNAQVYFSAEKVLLRSAHKHLHKAR
jgi:hypothetical protein